MSKYTEKRSVTFSRVIPGRLKGHNVGELATFIGVPLNVSVLTENEVKVYLASVARSEDKDRIEDAYRNMVNSSKRLVTTKEDIVLDVSFEWNSIDDYNSKAGQVKEEEKYKYGQPVNIDDYYLYRWTLLSPVCKMEEEVDEFNDMHIISIKDLTAKREREENKRNQVYEASAAFINITKKPNWQTRVFSILATLREDTTYVSRMSEANDEFVQQYIRNGLFGKSFTEMRAILSAVVSKVPEVLIAVDNERDIEINGQKVNGKYIDIIAMLQIMLQKQILQRSVDGFFMYGAKVASNYRDLITFVQSEEDLTRSQLGTVLNQMVSDVSLSGGPSMSKALVDIKNSILNDLSSTTGKNTSDEKTTSKFGKTNKA